jgi:hypothetical protein
MTFTYSQLYLLYDLYNMTTGLYYLYNTPGIESGYKKVTIFPLDHSTFLDRGVFI